MRTTSGDEPLEDEGAESILMPCGWCSNASAEPGLGSPRVEASLSPPTDLARPASSSSIPSPSPGWASCRRWWYLSMTCSREPDRAQSSWTSQTRLRGVVPVGTSSEREERKVVVPERREVREERVEEW